MTIWPNRTSFRWPLCWISISLVLRLACTGGDACAGLSHSPRRLALLVGIGKYYQLQPRPGYRPWPALHVTEELKEYRQVLIRDYGFAERDVRVLLDGQATKSEIQKAFREHLIAQASPGDIVLFHVSGHGQQLPDDDAPSRRDEPDGLDESLVPYDSLDQSLPEGIAKNIRDDELGDWLEELAARMRPRSGGQVAGNITVTLDTCFSASATRGGLVARGRSWDVSQDGARPAPRSDVPAARMVGILDRRGAELRDVTVVAAARADQTAWERGGHGIFTHNWVRLLARADKTSPPTYQEAVARLAVDIAAEGLDQLPQVEGAAEHLLFSGLRTPERQSQPSLRALRGAKGALWLQAGEVHGVTIGSEYSLYDTVPVALSPKAILARARVTEVSPFAARLEPLTPGSAARLRDKGGVLAVEAIHSYQLLPLRLVLLGFQSAEALRERIAKLDMGKVVTMQDGPEIPHLEHDLTLRIRPTAHAIELLRPTASHPQAEIALDGDSLDALPRALAAEWRWRHFAKLHHDNPAARVELELIPIDAAHRLPLPAPSSHIRLAQGKTFGLRLTNRSSRDLFASVIAVSPDGDINVLLGKAGQGKNRIRAGEILESPLEHLIVWKVVGKPGEQILIKVIATPDFVDFSGIESIRTAATARHPKVAAAASPLQALLAGLGVAVRGDVRLRVPLEWGITDASVTIEPELLGAKDEPAQQDRRRQAGRSFAR